MTDWSYKASVLSLAPFFFYKVLDFLEEQVLWMVENLVCVTIEEHEKIHNIIGDEAGKKFGEKIKKERGLGVPPEF